MQKIHEEIYWKGSFIIQMGYFSYLQNFASNKRRQWSDCLYLAKQFWKLYSFKCSSSSSHKQRQNGAFIHAWGSERVCECLCLYVYKRIFAKIVYIMKFTAWLHLLLHGFRKIIRRRNYCSDSVLDYFDLLLIDKCHTALSRIHDLFATIFIIIICECY